MFLIFSIFFVSENFALYTQYHLINKELSAPIKLNQLSFKVVENEVNTSPFFNLLNYQLQFLTSTIPYSSAEIYLYDFNNNDDSIFHNGIFYEENKYLYKFCEYSDQNYIKDKNNNVDDDQQYESIDDSPIFCDSLTINGPVLSIPLGNSENKYGFLIVMQKTVLNDDPSLLFVAEEEATTMDVAEVDVVESKNKRSYWRKNKEKVSFVENVVNSINLIIDVEIERLMLKSQVLENDLKIKVFFFNMKN
jgi:hypothetical protein